MIPGNSGCRLEFKEDTVVKYGGPRLETQMELQLGHNHPLVKTPRVFDCGGNFWFEMEYIRGAKFEVWCLDQLFNYVLDNLRRSVYDSINPQVFIDKINAIDCGEWQRYADELKQRFSGPVWLPVGPMHGDLSFTNVLCQGEDVYLIDFLDGVVSSPLFDIAKMRQDSYHGWIELFQPLPDREYIDQRIIQLFGHYDWLPELQLLCLLRIIPYAKDQRVIDFLRREIPRCIP